MRYKVRLVICFLILLCSAKLICAQTNLQLNKKIACDIKENETQIYQVNVQPNEFVRILIEQKKSDVKLKITLPNGEIYEFDNSNNREETERFSFIAETTGNLKIEVGFVKDLANKTTSKSYEIWLETERPVAVKDGRRIEAERLYDKANRLRFERDAAKRRESLPIFQQSIALFIESEDRIGEAFSHYATGQTLALLTELNEAKKGYDKAIKIFRELDLKPQTAMALYNSAPLFFRLDDVPQTLARLTEAEMLYRALDKKSEQAKVLNGFAVIYASQG